jgi:hypothetical protein
MTIESTPEIEKDLVYFKGMNTNVLFEDGRILDGFSHKEIASDKS